ncbi:flavodoxin family protein [bacterium]|nr:flavodoxin family protein [Candidatus Omnitrophota bacterium]MBU4123427.1 flavodoxin family protein [bacterium]
MKLKEFLKEISSRISKKNALAVNASPRKNGNCRKLVSLINAANPESSALQLNAFRVLPCKGCLKCISGACSLNDDFTKLITQLKEKEAVIIISPVFFSGIPAQLKAAIDRCQFYWSNKIKPMKNCEGYFVLTGERSEKDLPCCEKPVKAFFKTIGIKHVKSYYIPKNEIS